MLIGESLMLNKHYGTLFIVLFLSGLMTNVMAAVKQPLRHVSATECKACHEDIYSQWQGSMHANSTALKDPIHGKFYNAVVGSPTEEGVRKKGKYPVCLQCHAPAAAKDGKTDLTAKEVYKEGINCVACHTITKFKGTKKAGGGLQLGMQAYEYSDTSLQGTGISHTTADWAHPVFESVANSQVFKSNDLCMGCHDKRNNSNKVALCQTGDEMAKSGGENNCQGCHMPLVNGKADHSFLGGHSAKMVSKGLAMTMTHQVKQDNTLAVSIELANQLPHNLPTGAPFRNIYVKLTGYDKAGKKVWSSSQSHPAKDDKKAMLMYKLGDAEGNPAPPPKATQVLGDTRLKPYEKRVLNYSVPSENIAELRAVAYYDLLLPPMKNKFPELEHKELVTSKVIAVSEIQIKD